MVYFSNEILKFPRHFTKNEAKLTLINEVTNDVIEVDVEDVSEDRKYYEFDLTEVELKTGTYRYKIGEDCGLLQVGDYQSVSTTYDNKKTNVVYVRD